ncbi:MAG: SRPBCC family protein [Egibacteraceae bacterium]
MGRCHVHVDAPPQVLFDVLCDPASYIVWVVGSKHIRGVDASWPQPGSRIHHVVGWGPLEEHDTTEVLELEPPNRLLLEARAWPFGTADVEVTLTPEGDGTKVVMAETPKQGPAARFHNPLMELGLQARNLWSLRRLARWAEERHRGTPGHPPEPPS